MTEAGAFGLLGGMFSIWERNQELFAWLAGASLACFVASLVVVPALLIWMPHDFFARPEPKVTTVGPLRLVGRLIKNAFGAIFVAAGIVMLVLPGQGILSIVIGVSLLNFPGKRRLQLRLLRLRGVRRSIGWIRHKAGKRPLELPN